MMVKIKEIKEENEDDEYVKSSNKSSTPLLLPRLANGRTSLCLLLLVLVFSRYYCVLLFFFNLTRTLANVHFSRRTQGNEDERWFVREMFVFPSLWFLPWVLVSLDSMTKKKNHTRAFTLQARTTFPTLYTRAKHRWSSRE